MSQIHKATAKTIEALTLKYSDDTRRNIYARAHVDGEHTVVTNGYAMLRTTLNLQMFTKGVAYSNFANHETPYPDWRQVWPMGAATWTADIEVPEWCALIKKRALVGMRFHDAPIVSADHAEGMDALYLGLLPDRYCRVRCFGAHEPLLFSARGDDPQWEMVLMPLVLGVDSAILRRTEIVAKKSEAE